MKKRLTGMIVPVLFILFAAMLLFSSYLEIRVPLAPYPALVKTGRLIYAGLLIGLTAAAFLFFFFKRKPSVAPAAAGMLFFLGLIYMVVLPPFSSPDERAHYVSAYVFSSEMLFQKPFDEDGDLLMREADLFTSDGNPDEEMENAYLSENVHKGDYLFILSDLGFTDRTRMVKTDYKDDVYVSNRFARLPQAIGLAIGRLMHLSYTSCLFLGRFFGLLFACGCFYLALTLLPRGKTAMAVCGLLPMSIAQAASFSYDVLILALCLVYIAYVFRLRDQKGEITARQAILVILLLVAFTPWKLIYAVMALLLFVLPMSKFPSKKSYFICVGATVLAVGGALFLVNLGTLAGFVAETDTTLEHAGGVESYTLSRVLTHPVRSVKMVLATLRYQSDWYYKTLIGQYLGKLDVGLETPDLLTACFAVLTLLAGVRTVQVNPVYRNARDKIVSACVIVLIAGLTVFSMFIGWTPVGAAFIQGVQGRYFLYVLPLLLWFIEGDWITVKKELAMPILYGFFFLHALQIMHVMERIAFYR